MQQIDPCMFCPVNEDNVLAVWEVTKRCELRCPHCCSNSGNTFMKKDYSDISEEEAFRILNMLYEQGFQMVYFSGGEPLLWPHLVKIVEQALSYGMECYIATSGYSQKRETIEKLMRLPVSDFHISLDSYCAEQHDKFRGVHGAFQKALDFIGICKAHQKVVVTSSIISQDVVKNIDKMLLLLVENQVDRAAFNFLVPLGRATSSGGKILPTKEKIQIAEYIWEKGAHYNIPITINRIHHTPTLLKECPAGKYLAHINAYGEVSPCSWVGKLWDDMIKKPKDTLFDQKLLRVMRRRFAEIRNAKCGNCEHSSECGKGCPIIAYFEDENYDKLCGY